MLPAAKRNRLLAALPESELIRWKGDLELVKLEAGAVLSSAERRSSHVWFPIDTVVSLRLGAGQGAAGEAALVSSEGVIGLLAFLQAEGGAEDAVVLAAGWAVRLSAAAARGHFLASVALAPLLLRYARALLSQEAQNMVCERRHTLSQRLSRQLVHFSECLETDDVALTQAQLAELLGVRRVGVTQAAIRLRDAGLIHYTRGHITLLSREGLQRLSCACNALREREFARWLAPAAPACAGSVTDPVRP